MYFDIIINKQNSIEFQLYNKIFSIRDLNVVKKILKRKRYIQINDLTELIWNYILLYCLKVKRIFCYGTIACKIINIPLKLRAIIIPHYVDLVLLKNIVTLNYSIEKGMYTSILFKSCDKNYNELFIKSIYKYYTISTYNKFIFKYTFLCKDMYYFDLKKLNRTILKNVKYVFTDVLDLQIGLDLIKYCKSFKKLEINRIYQADQLIFNLNRLIKINRI